MEIKETDLKNTNLNDYLYNRNMSNTLETIRTDTLNYVSQEPEKVKQEMKIDDQLMA